MSLYYYDLLLVPADNWSVQITYDVIETRAIDGIASLIV